MLNFMKIRPKRVVLFHAEGRKNGWTDGQTDRHDEANSSFRNFSKAPKKEAKFCPQVKTMPSHVLLLTNKLHWIIGSTKSIEFFLF